MLWAVNMLLGGNKELAVSIDKDVIALSMTKPSRVAFYEIVDKFSGFEREYALLRFGFLLGIKMALKHTEEYGNFLIIMATLARLGKVEVIEEILRKELLEGKSLDELVGGIPL